MNTKKKRLLTIVLSVLGIAVAYDVYYFMGKRKKKSAAIPAPEPAAESTDSGSGPDRPLSPTTPAVRAADFDIEQAMAGFEKREQRRRFSQGLNGDWFGDPFLFDREEDQGLPLAEIWRLEEEKNQKIEIVDVNYDPIPRLLESMTLEATLVSGGKRIALINGLVLEAGAEVPGIEGLRVESVLAQSVVFSNGKKRYTIEISTISGPDPNASPFQQKKSEKAATEPPRQGEPR